MTRLIVGGFLEQIVLARFDVTHIPIPDQRPHIIVFQKPGVPHPLEQTRALPFTKAFPNFEYLFRAVREGFPFPASAKDMKYGLHEPPVPHHRRLFINSRYPGRKQRQNLLPEGIRDDIFRPFTKHYCTPRCLILPQVADSLSCGETLVVI